MKPRGPSPTLKRIPIGPPTPLRREDLEILHQGNRNGGSIKRLRASHHKIARLAAYGFTNKEIAAHTGYTRERVGQLLAAPAMVELVAVYMEKVEAKEAENLDPYLDYAAKNMVAAQRHLADHISELDEAGELLPAKTALAIQADLADRLGFGKRSTVTNLNVDMAVQLERAIKRSGKGPQIKTVQAVSQPRSIAAPPSAASAATQPPARPLIARRA